MSRIASLSDMGAVASSSAIMPYVPENPPIDSIMLWCKQRGAEVNACQQASDSRVQGRVWQLPPSYDLWQKV